MSGWEQGDGSLEDRLTLADWRRRVAALYVEVRGMAAGDPAIALAHWRAGREWLFREHPQSPLPVAERAAFHARHFDHDPALRFAVDVEPAPPPDPAAPTLELPNSGPDILSFRRIGTVRLPFPSGERRLSVFWLAGYAGGLFIPFRDATNGTDDVRCRSLPHGRRQVRRPRHDRRRPPHPRLQLRDAAVVRLRSTLGLPAGAAGEPPRHRGPGRRAVGMTGLLARAQQTKVRRHP